jgi:hypothetical protein
MEKDHADRSADRLNLKECIKLAKRQPIENWILIPDKNCMNGMLDRDNSYYSTFEDLESRLKVTVGKKSFELTTHYFINVTYSSANLAHISYSGNSEIKDLYREISSTHERFVNENIKKKRAKGLKIARSLTK